MGKLVERLNFGRIEERGTMPHFLEFQLDSYEDFLQAKDCLLYTSLGIGFWHRMYRIVGRLGGGVARLRGVTG